MTPQEQIDRYFLSRILWWRYELEQLDSQAIVQLVKVLKAVQKDIYDQFRAEAEGLASITDWNRERLRQIEAWIEQVLESAKDLYYRHSSKR